MFNIRPALLSDIPQINVFYDSLSAHKAPITFLQEVIDAKNQILFIAEDHDTQKDKAQSQCLGMIILQQQITPKGTYLPTLNFSYIVDLAVPDHEKKAKITMNLINAGKAWAKRQNSEYLELGF